jgi:hypothetical protein
MWIKIADRDHNTKHQKRVCENGRQKHQGLLPRNRRPVCLEERSMSTDQQIEANRSNAQRSTGPRTPAGKAKVSANALKHGLTGRQIVLPNEDPDEFDFVRAALLADLAPQGALENEYAEEYVVNRWRLRRVVILEAALYRRGFQEQIVERAAQERSRYETTESKRLFPWLEKTEVAAADRQAHEEAQQRLAEARSELDDPSFHVTHVLEMFPRLFSNLYRHEVALSRSMLRTLHELQRLQAQRAGEHVPPPSVVDVNINLPEPPPPVKDANVGESTAK